MKSLASLPTVVFPESMPPKTMREDRKRNRESPEGRRPIEVTSPDPFVPSMEIGTEPPRPAVIASRSIEPIYVGSRVVQPVQAALNGEELRRLHASLREKCLELRCLLTKEELAPLVWPFRISSFKWGALRDLRIAEVMVNRKRHFGSMLFDDEKDGFVASLQARQAHGAQEGIMLRVATLAELTSYCMSKGCLAFRAERAELQNRFGVIFEDPRARWEYLRPLIPHPDTADSPHQAVSEPSYASPQRESPRNGTDIVWRSRSPAGRRAVDAPPHGEGAPLDPVPGRERNRAGMGSRMGFPLLVLVLLLLGGSALGKGTTLAKASAILPPPQDSTPLFGLESSVLFSVWWRTRAVDQYIPSAPPVCGPPIVSRSGRTGRSATAGGRLLL
jgi:hypothetical protein